jgi:tRNA isopentenyl-2-thiomethyl-A-37 hydroxylase MiaE
LHPENRDFATRNLGKHHLIRKLNQLANDEFEKFFHVDQIIERLQLVELSRTPGSVILNEENDLS